MKFAALLVISLIVTIASSAVDENAVNDLTERATACTGKADIVFLLDSSGSVGSTNFKRTLQFVKDVVAKFSIGPNAVQIGVDTFSSSFRREFTLGRYSSKSSINRAVDSIRYNGGGTNTAAALTSMTSGSFTRSAGHRSGVRKIAVIITDGRSNSYSQTVAAARRARSAGIHLMAIGVGSSVNTKELNAIATDPDSRNVFRSASFSALSGLRSLLSSRLCTATSPQTTPVPLALGHCNYCLSKRFIRDKKMVPAVGLNCRHCSYQQILS